MDTTKSSLGIVYVYEVTHCALHTVFTWLNAGATISLMSKINAATIQERPLIEGSVYSIVQLLNCGNYSVQQIKTIVVKRAYTDLLCISTMTGRYQLKTTGFK